MDDTLVECEKKECAFKKEDMKKYPVPCRHCEENTKRIDSQGSFFVPEANY